MIVLAVLVLGPKTLWVVIDPGHAHHGRTCLRWSVKGKLSTRPATACKDGLKPKRRFRR